MGKTVLAAVGGEKKRDTAMRLNVESAKEVTNVLTGTPVTQTPTLEARAKAAETKAKARAKDVLALLAVAQRSAQPTCAVNAGKPKNSVSSIIRHHATSFRRGSAQEAKAVRLHTSVLPPPLVGAPRRTK